MAINMDLVLSVLGAFATLIGGAWALLRIIVSQFEARLDDRFAIQEKARHEARQIYQERFAHLEHASAQREREHLKLLADLPVLYVRREDQIRFETGINGKTIHVPALPVEVGGKRFGKRADPPRVGEHGAELLAELGCSPQEIERLRERRIVAL